MKRGLYGLVLSSFLIGCTYNNPLERELSKSEVSYSKVVHLINNGNNKKNNQKEIITFKTIADYISKNPTVKEREEDFKAAIQDFRLKKLNYYKPTFVANANRDQDFNRDFNTGIEIKTAEGIRFSLNTNFTYLKELKEMDKSLETKIHLPIPFLSPEFSYFRAEQFKDEVQFNSAKNKYLSTFREAYKNTIFHFIESLYLKEKIEIQENFMSLLKKVGESVKEEKLFTDISSEKAELDERKTEYSNYLNVLKKELGLDLDSEIILNERLEKIEKEFDKEKIYLEILGNDFNSKDLINNLKLKFLDLKAIKNDYGFRVGFDGQLNYPLDKEKEDEWIAGISVEFLPMQRAISEQKAEILFDKAKLSIKNHVQNLELAVKNEFSLFEEKKQKVNEKKKTEEDRKRDFDIEFKELKKGKSNYIDLKIVLDNYKEGQEKYLKERKNALLYYYILSSRLGEFDVKYQE